MPLKCNRQKGGVSYEAISLHSGTNNIYCVIIFPNTLLLVTKKREPRQGFSFLLAMSKISLHFDFIYILPYLYKKINCNFNILLFIKI